MNEWLFVIQLIDMCTICTMHTNPSNATVMLMHHVCIFMSGSKAIRITRSSSRTDARLHLSALLSVSNYQAPFASSFITAKSLFGFKRVLGGS